MQAQRLTPDAPEAAFAAAVSFRRLGHLDEAAQHYRRATELSPGTAKYQYGLGVVYREMDQPQLAYLAFRAAADLGMSTPQLFINIGRQAEKLPVERWANSTIGLTPVRTGDAHAALAAYEKAIQLVPNHHDAWSRVATLRQQLGDPHGAVEALLRSIAVEPSAKELVRLGRLLALVGKDTGEELAQRLKSVEIRSPSDAYRRAHELDPSRPDSKYAYARELMYDRQWSSAARLYLREEGQDQSEWTRDAAKMVELLDDPRVAAHAFRDRYDADVWLVLHADLLDRQEISLSYQAKTALAYALVANAPTLRHNRVSPWLDVARAHAFLGQYQDALGTLRNRQKETESQAKARMLTKLAADIELLSGDPAAHRSLTPEYTGMNLEESDRAFWAMIEGRRIAIVGPGEALGEPGEEIDAHDTVIRTKYVPDRLQGQESTAGSRTDLSYYAAESTRVLLPSIREALSRKELGMAVFRASLHPGNAEFLNTPGDLRYTPSENRALLKAGAFGIQRILYDVLRYRPQSVSLYNMDFFAGSRDYHLGYNSEIPSLLQTRTMSDDAFRMFTHCFLSDFVFVRNLHRFGHLDGDRRIEEILASTPTEYLERLEKKAAVERLG